MPTRTIRDEILTSEAVNRLSFPAEVFYRRLMSRVDDHGLYDARPAILRAELYALKIDEVTDRDVEAWLQECVDAGLVRTYVVDGQPYLQILKFGQRTRSKPKWPMPPDDRNLWSIDSDLPTSDGNLRADDGQLSAGGGQLRTTARLDVGAGAVADSFCPDADGSRPVKGRIPSDGRRASVTWSSEKGWQNITDDHIARWSEAYPACDVNRQLAAMDTWFRANPSRSKRKNYERFIVNWLTREQDRGGDARGAAKAGAVRAARTGRAAKEGAGPITPRFIG